jgi:hypothetical protein
MKKTEKVPTLEDILLFADLDPRVLDIAKLIRTHETKAKELRAELDLRLRNPVATIRPTADFVQAAVDSGLVSPGLARRANKASATKPKKKPAKPDLQPAATEREAAAKTAVTDAVLESTELLTVTGITKAVAGQDFYRTKNAVEALVKEGVLETVSFRKLGRDFTGYRLTK